MLPSPPQQQPQSQQQQQQSPVLSTGGGFAGGGLGTLASSVFGGGGTKPGGPPPLVPLLSPLFLSFFSLHSFSPLVKLHPAYPTFCLLPFVCLRWSRFLLLIRWFRVWFALWGNCCSYFHPHPLPNNGCRHFSFCFCRVNKWYNEWYSNGRRGG